MRREEVLLFTVGAASPSRIKSFRLNFGPCCFSESHRGERKDSDVSQGEGFSFCEAALCL